MILWSFDSFQMLLDFMQSVGYHQKIYAIYQTFPRSCISLDADKTLSEVGILRDVALNVEERGTEEDQSWSLCIWVKILISLMLIFTDFSQYVSKLISWYECVQLLISQSRHAFFISSRVSGCSVGDYVLQLVPPPTNVILVRSKQICLPNFCTSRVLLSSCMTSCFNLNITSWEYSVNH